MVTKLAERIKRVLKEEGMDRKKFVRKMGYENLNKGLRRLDNWRSGKEYPDPEHQLERLARVIEGSAEELEQLISWEKEGERLELREKRRQDRRYYLVMQFHKWVGSSKKLSEELNEEEALQEAKRCVREQVADKKNLIENSDGRYFIAALNTPDCKTYRFTPEGEVKNVTENSLPFARPHFAI